MPKVKPQLNTTSDEWFATGKRVHYDPTSKMIVKKASTKSLAVFEKVVAKPSSNNSACWVTFLPGSPVGSYEFHKIASKLDLGKTPLLFLDYVGQGDSDTPTQSHTYSTMERADLVEAHWHAKDVSKTLIVSFGTSSLVVMELLRRQQQRALRRAIKTNIEHVLSINGDYFADGHVPQSSPGSIGLKMAKKSNIVMDRKLLPLFSKSYQHKAGTQEEIREMARAIRRNQGTSFLKHTDDFAKEHKQHSERWSLSHLVGEYTHQHGIKFLVLGSNQDRFGQRQLYLARERLKSFSTVKVGDLSGGHMVLSEQPNLLGEKIKDLVRKDSVQRQQSVHRSWTTVDPPAQIPSTSLEIQVPSTKGRFPWQSGRS